MKIITPPHKIGAKKVEDPKLIIQEAIKIQEAITNGEVFYPGSKWQECFAVAHQQVSTDPLRYFVLNPEWKLGVKAFEGEIIVNPKLISKDRMTRIMFAEGCLSWPYKPPKKVKRFRQIVVSYVIINNKGRIKTITNKSLEELPAIVFQHELDHLNAKTIWDK